jgi:hypothetical protein
MSDMKAPRIQDLSKFTMFADAPGGGGQRSKLQWSIRGGNPRITIFTFNPVTNKNDIISAPLTPEVFLLFCDQFLSIINNNATNVKAKLDTYIGLRDEANKLTGEKRLLSELWYGVDENGLAWISVTEGDKPKVKFTFSLWAYNKIYKSDGSELTATEVSRAMADSTISALKNIYINNMATFSEYNTGASAVANKSQSSDKAVNFNVQDLDF